MRRHARARRFVLRVSSAGPGATLTLPTGAPRSAAIEFLESQEPWLRERLSRQGQRVRATIGAELPFRGSVVRIVDAGHESRLRLRDGSLQVPGRASAVPSKVRAFFHENARQEILARTARYSAILGVQARRITLRDPRSRWGSCTSEGNLMFSWRLVMAPVDVLDYVVAHEVAHLVEMNHSERFWDVVAQICPVFATQRQWLRENGAHLHCYDFSNS